MRQPPTSLDRTPEAGLPRCRVLAFLRAALLPLAGPPAPPAVLVGAPCLGLTSGLGNAAVDHFYLLRARCGSAATSRDRVGDFDVALVAGAP